MRFLNMLLISLFVNLIIAQENFHDTIWEFNRHEIAVGDHLYALMGATALLGEEGAIIKDATIIIKGNRIMEIGSSGSVDIPAGAEKLDLSGKFILPGMLDAHFHEGKVKDLLPKFLAQGVTSLRDPGAWNESYLGWRKLGAPIQRLFLTGPHLDQYPPAYPLNSMLVRDAREAEFAVNDFIDEGATAIKVYFRLPLGTIETICQTAHSRGVPVTAHLEITKAKDAIKVGLDGIEHITSFGTSLIHPRDAEKYKQLILADNNARRKGRYEVWKSVDLQDTFYLNPLLKLLRENGTFVSPNLAVFEKQPDQGDSIEVEGFARMLEFTGMIDRAGGNIVVGSHTFVPYAELGLGYAHEMELLVQAGMTTGKVIEAATIQNARFFRVEERLGSLAKGKLADLVVLSSDPLENISNIRQVEKVMLNGVWVK
ncbi:MAG: amidohydrolase family protein [Saprospiraceae bacterium]|nr:amidohydrolase family protein [Saprospiraceae bacterium]